jgi:hypothetical protein
MKILNLTQHPAAPEQIAAGVVEPRSKEEVQNLLTFESLPTRDEILTRAEKLADIAAASGYTAAMIGGAPYFMSALERALVAKGVRPLYAFSRRVVVETVRPDGAVEKKGVFKHAGFVEAVL